jgi:hypothetical protein
MINEHGIEDMATRLVGKSFGETVPKAAMPSLIQFMQEVAEESARVCMGIDKAVAANVIRSHFGIPVISLGVLLNRKAKVTEECGK